MLQWTFFKENFRPIEKIIRSNREEIEQFPESAFRECLANAICHRDYKIPSFIQINCFENDRIEIISPGVRINPTINPNQPNEFFTSSQRNPIICNIFRILKITECAGSGIKKIWNAYEQSFSKPSFKESNGCFVAILPIFQPKSDPIFQKQQLNLKKIKLSSKTNERLETIINLMKENPNLTVDQLVERTKFNKNTILKDIQKLKAEQKIERIGSNKTGYWKVNE